MSIINELNNKKFVYLKNLVSKDRCDTLASYLKEKSKDEGVYDSQCGKSKAFKGDPNLDKLLEDVLPDIEAATGKKLLPAYSYARYYVPGEELKIHIDRPACEISVTLTLGYDGKIWPIYMGEGSDDKSSTIKLNDDGKEVYLDDVYRVETEVGDAVLYKGCEIYHWREKYKEGNWQAQVFLHYVDANGPFKDHAYEYKKKPKPNMEVTVLQQNTISTDLTNWFYDDILSEKECEAIIEGYKSFANDVAKIGEKNNDNTGINTSIRNVNKVDLPTHKGIGAILTAAGINANRQRWNFDIDGPNQCEFLRYPAGGGRYKGHLDTFLIKDDFHMNECRKLTVLAFLNDDFTGGKFFLQTGSERFYPPQKKGTVLVFPSFLLHGVEDVESGERYSVVSWLVGPWFK